jgi:hypothetical protein
MAAKSEQAHADGDAVESELGGFALASPQRPSMDVILCSYGPW